MDHEKTAVFTFGRMNPPTAGHEKLINATIAHAKKVGGTAHIYVSHSHNTPDGKNPLSAEDRVSYLKKAHPKAHIGSSSKAMPSFLHIAEHLHKQGAQHLHMVVGEDRVKEFHDKLHSQNGKLYNFKSIKVVSAGHRDPDAEGVEGMSGTKMREAARAGHKEKFMGGLHSGIAEHHKKEIYKKVRSSMGLSEDYEKKLPALLMTEQQKEAMLPSYRQYVEQNDIPVKKEERLLESSKKPVSIQENKYSFKSFIADALDPSYSGSLDTYKDGSYPSGSEKKLMTKKRMKPGE